MKNLKKIRKLYRIKLEEQCNIKIMQITNKEIIFEYRLCNIASILNFLVQLACTIDFKYNSHPSRIVDFSGMTLQTIGKMKIEYLMYQFIEIVEQNEKKI